MELDIPKLLRMTEKGLRQDLFTLLTFFITVLIGFSLLLFYAPSVPTVDTSVFLVLPNSVEKIQNLAAAVQSYREESFYYSFVLFCYTYLFLQSFAIPGPIFLSQIAGVVLGRWVALLTVSLCATIGSTFCYLLSDNFGKGLVIRLFPGGLEKINSVIMKNKKSLMFYLMFLRVMPILPNWMINLMSPIIGVPLKDFIIATLFGLMPPNFLYISAGITLKSMQEQGADYQSLIILLVIGVLVLIPVLIKKEEVNNKVKV